MAKKKNKIEHVKIPVKLTEAFVLTRHDGLVRKGNTVMWIEWNENGSFKERYDKPAIGLSCILDGNRMAYTWLTTTVTEFGENEDGSIWFNTENSKYTLKTETSIEIDDLLP
jgi:hypothetical protein